MKMKDFRQSLCHTKQRNCGWVKNSGEYEVLVVPVLPGLSKILYQNLKVS